MKPAKSKKPAKKTGKTILTKVKEVAPRRSFTNLQQAEVTKVYLSYWDNYLTGKVKSMAALLESKYTQVGSAEGEVFFNKKSAVKFLYDTINQVAGKLEMRNRKIKLEQQGNHILIHELCDLYALVDVDWIFYSKFRASTLMHKRGVKWKFIHQHSSFPDIRAQEGENVAIEKIAAENLQLRDAVKRRTIELEYKNRELEIEASLERVRAQAMSMSKPNDLTGICEVLYEELKELDFAEIRNAMINIHDDDKGTFVNYDYSDEIGKRINYLVYNIHPVIEKQIRQIRSAGDAFSETSFKGKDLRDWKTFRRKIGEKDDPRIKKAKALYYYFYSIGTGSIGISTFSPINEEKLRLLKRFRNVFTLSYQRYLDIVAAGVQAREAKIEAALERVRSRSMAMHSSTELKDVITLVMEQFKQLGFPVDLANFNYLSASHDWTMWLATTDYAYPEIIHVPYLKHPLFDRPIDAYMKGLDFMSDVLTRKEKDSAMHHFYQTSVLGSFDNAKRKKMVEEGKGLARSIAFMKHIALTISNFNAIPYTDEQNVILKRFANVFEQSYTRFLDLQKAEAQAREGQIQLALERVRARTMAMQKSDELREVAALLFEQINGLGFETFMSVIVLVDKTTRSYREIVSSHTQAILPQIYNVPYMEDTFFNRFMSTFDEGVAYKVIELGGEEKKEYDKKLFYLTDFSLAPEETKQMMMNTLRCSVCCAYMRHGCIAANGDQELSAEQAEILQRFAKVFEQAYVRFLDLQKAERQTREAQIELAVERVRAKALAMHKSEEISATVNTLRLELVGLTIPGVAAATICLQQPNGFIRLWDITSVVESRDEFNFDMDFVFSLDETEPTDWIRRIWDPQQKYFVVEQDETDIDKTVAWTRKYNPQFANTARRFLTENNIKQVWHPAVSLEHGKLSLDMFQPPVSDVEPILIKIGAAFDLAYKRFLDLQKAESQTREAQIEVAVERVRAKALAMHKSEEIIDVVKSLRQEMESLQIPGVVSTTIYLAQEDGRIRFWDITTLEETEEGAHFAMDKYIRLQECPDFLWFQRMFRSKEKYLLVDQANDELIQSMQWIKEFINEEVATSMMTFLKDNNITQLWHPRVLLEQGVMNIDFIQSPPAEVEPILIKMGAAFDLAHKRFRDLQKAETQAREAQIEAALEKVRSASLAMHRSEELGNVVAVLFGRLSDLGIRFDAALIYAFDTSSPDIHLWVRGKDIEYIWLPNNEDAVNCKVIQDFWSAVRTGEHIINRTYSGNVKDDYLRYTFKHNKSSEVHHDLRQLMFAAENWTVTLAAGKNSLLGIDSWSGVITSDEDVQILKRFANVFEQSYTRFLDLQKAEAQAREAKIEAALERVRSRSMAMHKSEELLSVITVVSDQLQHLNFKFNTVSFAINNQADDYTFWFAIMGDPNPIYMQVPYIENPMADRLKDVMARGADFYSDTLTPEESRQWHEHVFAYVDIPSMNGETKAYILRSAYARSMAIKPSIMLIVSNYAGQPYSDDQNEIIKRFATVFEQSYTRFLDLQKAEAQAREAQIEAALERVRARTMAMQKSTDLLDVANVLREQIGNLGQPGLESSIVHIYRDEGETLEAWYAFRPPNLTSGEVTMLVAVVPTNCSEWSREVIGKYKSSETEYTIASSGEKISEWYTMLERYAPETVEYNGHGERIVPEILYYHFSKFSGGALLLISNQQPSEEARELQRRAAVVFDLAYTRFLDLKNAEAQAREAKIEASLERVRSKAMAMHSSEDLSSTIGIFYHELESFSITPRRCGVGLLDKETRWAELSTMNTTEQGDSLEIIGKLKMLGHPVLEGVFENWILQQEYHPVLRGNEIREYYQLLRPQISFPEYPNDAVQFGYFFFFPEGGVYAWTENELSEDELRIYRRFTSVLSLTYKRYKDLKDAEAREQEAIKQAALDRVRADIASMRSTTDLDRITPLIWKELTTLGIPFIRCGVFIMDEKENKVHTYLSTPDGHAIAAYHILMDDSGSLSGAIEHWRQQKVYVTYWVESDFQTQADILLKQGSITTREQYLNAVPKGGFHLHFLPFRQGTLYVGSIEPLPSDALHLVQALAETFSVAYARYEDFTRLELAKQQIEKTLVDLKQTQSQLVQSEKMASLGELTAGIAHEIQNPLNFVNNFSEVSNELLDEMKQEIEKGNYDEVKTITNDVKQNLEKILHHGKRADGIVKGMLQHSRSSSGVKEPTNINTLVDEYLRLAYHGLRAKDKSFNATMKTEFDEAIGDINIVPQDMGRVILNLITNAFYAVSEKQKAESLKRKAENVIYEPTVFVSTRKDGNKVLISVKDNGNGIPDSIKEKIFQPFFTTKPTGQGTGLGLSLSYDIVKAHEGILEVLSTVGHGSEFRIQLPTKIS